MKTHSMDRSHPFLSLPPPSTMSSSLVFLGHISCDVNTIGNDPPVREPGGGVYYGAVAAGRLRANPRVLTKVNDADQSLFTHTFTDAGCTVTYLPTSCSTSCCNVFPSATSDHRVQHYASIADPFTRDDLESLLPASTAKNVALILSPLWHGEVEENLLPWLRSRAFLLVVDAQGFIRQVNSTNGCITRTQWETAGSFLPLIDVLKVDDKEASLLTGEVNFMDALRALHSLGASTVLASHKEGIILSQADGTMYEASFSKPYTAAGRNGRGDTVTASFITAHYVHGKPVEEALRFTADIVTQKMQYRGPLRADSV